MKNIIKYLGGAAVLVSALTACSPDSFSGMDENGIPVAENYAANVKDSVDQTNNKVYLECKDEPGTTHVWIIPSTIGDPKYTTSVYDTLTYKYAGDYYVDVKFINKNGMSNGSIRKTFHINHDFGFNGFKYDSEYNLWKKATVTGPKFWYAPGWNQIADPACVTLSNGYKISLPTATTNQWMAQMKLASDISTASSKNYDFSILLTATKDHPNATVKLDDPTNDKVFYFADQVALKAGVTYCFYKSDMKGLDINNVELVLDFGGNADNTDVTIENIVLKDHANDDGTVVPAPVDNTDWADFGSDLNLWKPVNAGGYTTSFYTAQGSGWSQIDNPTFTDDKKGTYTLVYPLATDLQWQAQFKQISTVPLSASETYDFQCTLLSSKDVKASTVKLGDTSNDNNYLFVKNVDLTAGEATVVKVSGAKCSLADAAAAQLVFDFGGNPANTTVKISNIILQKHKEK